MKRVGPVVVQPFVFRTCFGHVGVRTGQFGMGKNDALDEFDGRATSGVVFGRQLREQIFLDGIQSLVHGAGVFTLVVVRNVPQGPPVDVHPGLQQLALHQIVFFLLAKVGVGRQDVF